jgi:uncharacterized membrane protein
MDEQELTPTAPDITADDRLWAALAWLPLTPLWPLLAILALLLENTRDRPFVRRHALLSLVTGAVLIPVSILTLGCGALLYLVFFYWAYLAMQGQEARVPFLSDWVRRQGWA